MKKGGVAGMPEWKLTLDGLGVIAWALEKA